MKEDALFYKGIVDIAINLKPSAVRVTQLVLRGCEFDGWFTVSDHEVAKVLGYSSMTAHKALELAIECGWLNRDPKEKYSLSIHFTPYRYTIPEFLSDERIRFLFYDALKEVETHCPRKMFNLSQKGKEQAIKQLTKAIKRIADSEI